MTTATKTRSRSKSTATKRDLYQEITDKMVASLEQGVAPWRKPWSVDGAPRNLDGKDYRGINTVLLMLTAMEQGYGSPFWMTFKQAQQRGGRVKKGEHGTMIVFWKRLTVADKDDPTQIKSIPMLRHYYVFNLDQTEDVKLPEKVANWLPKRDHQPHEAAEAVLSLATYVKPPTVVETGSAAFYDMEADKITLPPRDSFPGLDDFYSTAFHEMGHSTGHKDRLDRPIKNVFGSHDYGREELVAEMTATFLASETGIETTFDNSASYLGSWIRTIKEDPRAVVVAAGQAQKAVDLILGRTWED
jgi:antirestriction protein ArdC